MLFLLPPRALFTCHGRWVERTTLLPSFLAQNKSDQTLPPCAWYKLCKIENKNISLWFSVPHVSHKGMHAVNLRHKKANGLLQPSAWGGLFFSPHTRSTSITSISNLLQAAGSVCTSCHSKGPSAEAAAVSAEVDISADKPSPLYHHCHCAVPSVSGDIDVRQQWMRQK